MPASDHQTSHTYTVVHSLAHNIVYTSGVTSKQVHSSRSPYRSVFDRVKISRSRVKGKHGANPKESGKLYTVAVHDLVHR